MAVTALPRDSVGAALSARVTSLSTQATALANGPSKFAAEAKLDEVQRELVYHYMSVGRLTAARILSTMS